MVSGGALDSGYLQAKAAAMLSGDYTANFALRTAAKDSRLVVADAAEWAGGNGSGEFDGILVDAPCSSTGTIRRHPDVAWLRQESIAHGDLANCAC